MLRPALTRLAAALIAFAGTGSVAVQPAAATGCVTLQGPVGAAFADCSAGSTFNILPPGQDGLVSVAGFASGSTPRHQQDQWAMYADLKKVAPNLQPADLGKYYKSSAFGVAPADVERVETPAAGLTILRDRQFGVPHIYGETRYAAEFGAGYAAAEDRLFFMDLLRHVGRSQLSAFLGPSAADLALDCSTARVAGYNEEELQQQVDRARSEHRRSFRPGVTEGEQLFQDGSAYVDGINQYIREALTDPGKMPAEYPALQEVPVPWKLTDVVAVATIVQAIFATGGGGEVDSALLQQALTQRYPGGKGLAIWQDLRSQNDPEAPTTIDQPFPYMLPGTVDPNAVARPAAAPVSDFCNGSPIPTIPPGAGTVTAGPVSIDLSFLLKPNRHASNALLVNASNTSTGHPVAVFGPQVSYFAPQILHEMDIHGPGIDARGAAFPGTDIYVELGRGVDYAWSATSAGSDIVDERLERLCNLDGSAPTTKSTAYLFNGSCVPMYERTDRQVAKPSPGAPGLPQVVTIQIERSIHGPVIARGYGIDPESGAQVPVAVSYQRSTWFDELGSAAAFLNWNDPAKVRRASDFIDHAAEEDGTFNWFYVDSRDTAYYSSGKMPLRAAGVDPNLPSWGTGQWEWQGFLPASKHPQAISPPRGWMTSWNNKPAPQWSAADSQYGYGPVYRNLSLDDRVKAAIARGKVVPVDIVNAMEDAGSVDLDGSQLVPQLKAALAGAGLSASQQQVLSLLDGWAQAGSHRRENPPGRYDSNGVTVMDDLYPRLTHAIFDPWLDPGQYGQLAGMMGINDAPGPKGSAYDGGWEGYLQRALRQAVNPAIANPYSQNYCGGGSLTACQSALRSALQSTIDHLTQVYGSPDPATWTCDRSNSGDRCNPARDDIVFSAVGLEKVPNMPWINRPTFQQVVQYPESR